MSQRRVLVLGANIGAYVVVRALRRHAEVVGVAVEPGDPRPVRRSRHVDFCEPVVSSRHAERYADSVLGLARRRGISHVVPVKEREMLALSPFRARFAECGVELCCSDFEAVRGVSSKTGVLGMARAHRVPVPSFVRLPAGLDRRAAEVNPFGYPVVVKGEFSSGALGVRLADDPDGLDAAVAEIRAQGTDVALHEYVPGGSEPSLTAFLDRDGRVLRQIWLRKLRYAGPSHSCCVVTTEPPPGSDRLLSFLRSVGLRGPVGVQMKSSARTGEDVLIEVNPRLGQNARILTRICARAGVDFGEVFLACFDGTTAPAAAPTTAPTVPAGMVGLSLPEDLIAFAKFLGALRRTDHRPDNPVPRVSAYLRSYYESYRRRPVLDIASTALLDDARFAVPAVLRAAVRLAREPYRLVPYGSVDHLTPDRSTSRAARGPAGEDRLA